MRCHSPSNDITDVTCAPSMTVSNAVKNTSLALHGTVVEYRCSVGYGFTVVNVDQNVTTTRAINATTITCQDDGNWTMISSDCLGWFDYHRVKCCLACSNISKNDEEFILKIIIRLKGFIGD